METKRGSSSTASARVNATPASAARWAASLALKKLKLMPDQIARFERDFEPEVGAVDGAGSINSRS